MLGLRIVLGVAALLLAELAGLTSMMSDPGGASDYHPITIGAALLAALCLAAAVLL